MPQRHFIIGQFRTLSGKKINFTEPVEYFMGTFGKPQKVEGHGDKLFYSVCQKGNLLTVTPDGGRAYSN